MSSAKGKKAKPGKKATAAKPKKAESAKKAKAADASVPATEVVELASQGEASAELEAAAEDSGSSQPADHEASTPEPEAEEAAAQQPADGDPGPAELAAGEDEAPSDDDAPLAAPAASTTAVADLPRPDQKRLVESLVFVSDRAINAMQLGRMLKIKSAYAKELVEELMLDYQGRGIELVELSGGYQFRSAPSSAHVVREHIAQPPVRLTRAQLETLALVAYRQPITRPEIDDVRGVDSGSALRVLLERGLLKMLGRKDEPGRPLLYGTTPFFLDFFGMRSLKDLPTLREFTELSDENRALFKRKTGETIEEAEAALLAAEEAAQQEGVSAPIEGEDGAPPAGQEAEEGVSDELRTAEGEPSDRDLEVEAETFAAGSLQTSPDSSAPAEQVDPDGEDDDFEDDGDEEDGDEREPPPSPEA